MNEKYQIEIKEFIDRFERYQDKKIALYGIGRYTATLLEGIEDYNFVGLMDKDSSKVGQTVFGLPIIDKATAEKTADMVIINTTETYGDIIDDRISDIRIPVFYIDGEKADKKESVKVGNL